VGNFPEKTRLLFAPVVIYKSAEHHKVQCNNIKKIHQVRICFAPTVFYRYSENHVVYCNNIKPNPNSAGEKNALQKILFLRAIPA
jgi:hypothetical protein